MPSTTVLTNNRYKITIGTETGTKKALEKIADNLRNLPTASTTSNFICRINEARALLSACSELLLTFIGVLGCLKGCLFAIGLLIVIPMGVVGLILEYKVSEKRGENRD